MKQVDFYLIGNNVVQARYKLTGRLALKLQHLKQRTLIVTNTEAQTMELDDQLWSFSDASFLAHDLANNKSALAPVQITSHSNVDDQMLSNSFDVLINLSKNIPVYAHQFSRIAEVIAPDETAKAEARHRYKGYQTEGFTLKTHSVEL